MRRHFRLFALWAALLMLPATTAWGALSDYSFTTGTTTYTALTGATVLINSAGTAGNYNELAVAGPTNIGFNFVFDGVTYSQFTVNTNGLMTLGSTTTSSYSNSLQSPPVSNPIIAPFWDHLHMYDGNAGGGVCTSPIDVHVSYLLEGSAPNRVLVVEWHTQFMNESTSQYFYAGNCLPFTTFQVRLYEQCNRISFTYGAFRQGSTANLVETASIGIAWGSNNFMSVTPGSPATMSRTTANNSVDNYQLTSTTLIAQGSVYTFAVGAKVVGRTGTNDGGTTAMNNGDQLLSNFSVQKGSAGTYTPFNLNVPAAGCALTYRLQITGAAAADYYFGNGTSGSQTQTGTLSPGNTITPQITFRPVGIGRRTATLTIEDLVNGGSYAYTLYATGTSRIQWQGNLAQGGTPTVAHGDTLLKNINVNRRSSRNFTPLTLQNINLDPAQISAQAPVTYTINDPTGQYSITPGTAPLGANQSSTPTITFAPTGAGSQSATLTVNADGEVRTYVLYAFSAAPGADFIMNGVKLSPAVPGFVNAVSCVGDVANTQQITVNNVGVGDVTIDQIDFYRTDTVYQQGTPSYPLLRDKNGNPIPSPDYFISTQPGTIPFTPAQLPQLPILIPTGQNRTIYITYIGNYPGKRFARAFIRSNAQNFTGTDLNGVPVEGLVSFDVVASAIGSSLSDNAQGGRPKAVEFPETHAGDSADVTFSIFNTGACDLRISKTHLRIHNGDVNEFRLISAFVGVNVNGNDYVLAPGTSGTLTVRFLPTRSGARRATIWLRTNDSTIGVQGITNRGDFFLDLVGNGKAGIDFKDVVFPDAIIDAESAKAEAFIVNSSREALTIANLAIIGTDAAEFMEDPAKPWPARPKTMLAGEELHLAMVHTPVSGSQPGGRSAVLQITLTNGEIRTIGLTGRALTRTLTLTLTKLFTTISVGQAQRRIVEVRNSSWAPVTVQALTLSGPDASEFQIGVLPRMVLDSGQVEYLEVTFLPSRAGTASATLTVTSNGTNGTQTVTLSARGVVTSRDGADGDATAMQRNGGSDLFGETPQTGTSSVGSTGSATGLELSQSVPNPASGEAVIRYALKESGDVVLRLYDEQGREVAVLDDGHRGSGEHVVRLDVSGLASGVYHYRLETGGRTITRTLRVVR